jgi:hypothetical protein
VIRDDLSTGVRVSTVRIEEDDTVWYETLAYIPEPYYCGEDPEVTYTMRDAENAHERRCKRALGLV